MSLVTMKKNLFNVMKKVYVSSHLVIIEVRHLLLQKLVANLQNMVVSGMRLSYVY